MRKEYAPLNGHFRSIRATNDDLRSRPGDSFRFNVVYFDAFQVPMTKTRMGGVFGLHLDKADDWATLRLAANVKDDGGAAFQSPAWVKALTGRLKSVNPSRLRVISETLVPGSSPPTAKAVVSFTYRDPQGKEQEAKAKIFLPESIHAQGDARHPLFFAAGYELPDGLEHDYASRGWVIVSPHELETNPLIRTINPDVALLHLARAFPWVDDTRVVIGGGSAGGWMTLMLAGETFPLAGAAPDVPPVNWGYNGSLFRQTARQGRAIQRKRRQDPRALCCGDDAQALRGSVWREFRRRDLVRRLAGCPGFNDHLSCLGLFFDC